ncbi:MAG TPA: class I SAM-dependent methyltransferase [Vicinamibacterales bacterium]|nr:class I SAM-dependent methyltransferase [Vicinamibacterales bacterium]
MDAILTVHDFWNSASCGEDLYLANADKAGYLAQSRRRYALEPFIPAFANAAETRDRDVLEIGVGLGADHQLFAEAGSRLTGIDLTKRAIDHVRSRFEAFGLQSDLRVANAESLPFRDQCFDLAYSWGVLHHTRDTPRAVGEAWRVLRPGGQAKVMMYQRRSLVGFMLWCRYAVLAGRPWQSLNTIFANHMESPGTRAYSVAEARDLFRNFASVTIHTVLTHGDLLESDVGQRHRGRLLSLAKQVWPRRLLRAACPGRGLYMLIKATK